MRAVALTCLSLFAVNAFQVSLENQEPKEQQRDDLDSMLSDEVQKSCGLRKLARDERLALTRLMRAQNTDQRALDEARQILESMGLETVRCSLESKDGAKWLVVAERVAGHSATKDLPITFPEYTFADGLYWCDRSPLGGIERIYVHGQEYRFLLADWKKR